MTRRLRGFVPLGWVSTGTSTRVYSSDGSPPGEYGDVSGFREFATGKLALCTEMCHLFEIRHILFLVIKRVHSGFSFLEYLLRSARTGIEDAPCASRNSCTEVIEF
jgi:hypothetical protein